MIPHCVCYITACNLQLIMIIFIVSNTFVTHSNYTYRIVSIGYRHTNIIIHEGSELYLCNGSEIEIRQRQHAVRVTIIVLATSANIHMRVIFFACMHTSETSGRPDNKHLKSVAHIHPHYTYPYTLYSFPHSWHEGYSKSLVQEAIIMKST